MEVTSRFWSDIAGSIKRESIEVVKASLMDAAWALSVHF